MNILRKTLLVSVVISIAVISAGHGAPAQEKKIGVKTIVLDAGHGGKDPGCRYGGYNEKDITLAVALRLGALV